MQFLILKNQQGQFPRKMIKFNLGLSEILGTVFLLRACNWSLQNTVEPLLWETVFFQNNAHYTYPHD